MSGIIAGFGTPHPVIFKEKGCNTEFAARVSGALYIDEYDEAAYGETESERKSSLAVFAAGKIEEHLSKWDKDDCLLGVDGEERLGLMLTYDLMEAGMNGSARVKDISITDETNELYHEQIMKPYREAKQAEREKEIEAADEPHGPLRQISYNLSSHGMMAGTSSGSSRSVEWKRDGTVIYRFSSYGGGTRTEREYKIAPEMAQKISDYVTAKRLAALSKMDIPTVAMFDNFTSATICMTFDDSSIGGEAYNRLSLNCGPSCYTFKSIEDGLYELLEECEATGECIKNDMTQTNDGFGPMGGFNGMLRMGLATCTAAPDLDGMKQAQERMMKAPVASSSTSNEKWTCKCGSENTGKFCPECGEPKPNGWTCSCGTENTGKFCYNCGQPRD